MKLKSKKSGEHTMPKRGVSKRRRKLSRLEKLVLAVPMVAAVVAVLVVTLVVDHGASYTLTRSGHQYYGGSMAAIPAGTKLRSDENGAVEFVGKAFEEGNETYLPVYMDDTPMVLLTDDMAYYMPRTDEFGRVPALSELTCQANGLITISRENYTVKPKVGFLHNGGDFYIFMEPMVVRYNNYAVTLPALSYAEVRNGGTIMLFDYETKAFVVEELQGSATAESSYGEYKISLLGDSMTNSEGELTLLISRPEVIDLLQ